jgi:hypothetical protein
MAGLLNAASDAALCPLWRVPDTATLSRGDAPFQLLIEGLTCLEPLAGRGDLTRISRLATTKYVILFEFCSGTALNAIEAGNPWRFFGDAVLRRLGSTLLFDVLINNWDRLPLRGVCENEGNLGNVLVDVDGDAVTIIDQTVTVISVQHRAPFLAALDTFFRDVWAWREAGGEACDPDDATAVTTCMAVGYDAAAANADGVIEGHLLDTVRRSLKLHTGHDIGLRGQVLMLQGLCVALRTLGIWERTGGDAAAQKSSGLREELHAVKAETLRCMLGGLAGGKQEAATLGASMDECVEFCGAVLDCVTAAGRS